jgi:hypothetical protein
MQASQALYPPNSFGLDINLCTGYTQHNVPTSRSRDLVAYSGLRVEMVSCDHVRIITSIVGASDHTLAVLARGFTT